MSFFKRAKEVAGDLGAASKRQAQRGKLEIEVRRLESKVGSEKDQIGHAVFPMLEAGTLTIDAAEVQEHMTAIASLNEEIAAKKAEIDELTKDDDEGESSDGEAKSEPETAAPSGTV